MKHFISRFPHFLLLIVFFMACSSEPEKLPALTYTGEEPKIQNPLSPEASQKHIQLPEGFETVLFAAEPDIINPIAFAWDERGRLWVVQSMDYPHGLDNDVGGDRITICEDTDGDGKADKFIDYATDQSLSTGIVIVKGGIIVPQAPEMVFLEDTDGDDKMDKRTVLFGGFGTYDTHAGPSALRYGLDNKIWGSVGYSGFENNFEGKNVNFKMGVYSFSRDGKQFEPVGQFNNNTWGLGITENFEIFGSTANNNHACYVGIPLKHYEYLNKRPSWALNADFIQGHYEITPATGTTVPLQQVDVRGGYTAASGANFYTARNYPEEYINQMYINEPTGHLIHIAKIVEEGAGYKEVDGGNIFASTDAWSAPVFAETGPDGNLWVADWYNPVIQHNPDKRGMDNQIWNANRGEGNAHLNEHRDKGHGRIYIIKHEDGDDDAITEIDFNDNDGLIEGLESKNMFWRTTAQRLIVENNKQELVPDLIALANSDAKGLNGAAVHALWTLKGLGALGGSNNEASTAALNALTNNSTTVNRAGITLLPNTVEGSEQLVNSSLLQASNLHIRLAAILRASELPETETLYKTIESIAKDPTNTSDKWLNAAIKIYFHELNYETVDPKSVDMVIPSAAEEETIWRYTETKPTDDWNAGQFDDAGWSEGPSLFGGTGINASLIKTKWTSDDIWMRRTVTLNALIKEPVLKISHNDNYEVYVNGQLLAAESGVSKAYKYIKIDSTTARLFKKGNNIIAVHCHNNGGGQYIDLGIGAIGVRKADIVLTLNTVNQEMAYDKKVLYATAGQYAELVLNNKDQMPHNVVVIDEGSLEPFGKMVDKFLDNPDAANSGYIPKSRYVLAASKMLNPGEKQSIFFKVPDKPGRYPFVCTFPGHWKMMQGVIIVNGPGTYISEDPNAINLNMLGGGNSHDFLKFFGIADGKFMSKQGATSVTYTESPQQLGTSLDNTDILYLCNNKAIDSNTKEKIFSRANEGMGMLIYHPSIWYNWKDWPEYNKQFVGGGSESHEKLQEFEVRVVKPNHPIMKGVPPKFRIVDELYRYKKDPEGADIEVLAIGKGLESGEEFPVIWTVKHPNTKIVCNTLGHDERAHDLPAYQTALKNSLKWVREK